MNGTLKALCIVLSALIVASCQTNKEKATETAITKELVEEAYVWGLPIVSMYRYYKFMRPNGEINTLFHNRDLIPPGVLSGGPNRDGLYSYGWFDLNDEPIVVSLPDFGERYFVWQITDMYATNFHNVGSYLREGPNEKYRAGYTFLMAGPDWEGEIPEGIELVRCPVNVVNVLYRIAFKNNDEIQIVRDLQDNSLMLPLSEWNTGKRESIVKPPTNPIPDYRDVLTFKPGVKGSDQRNIDYFSVLADAINANRPYADWDLKIVNENLKALGIEVGQPFVFENLDEATKKMILDAQEAAFDEVIARGDTAFGVKMNGWLLNPSNHGQWKDDFWNRAYATYTGGMYPSTNNSTYATTYFDSKDVLIDGESTYKLRFDTDNYPPATSFWSITAYDAGTRDLFPNEWNLHNYGTNVPFTKYEEDGTFEVIISHQRPANAEEINWFPIPEDGAWMCIRFYAPKQEVIDLDYEIPGIEKIN